MDGELSGRCIEYRIEFHNSVDASSLQCFSAYQQVQVLFIATAKKAVSILVPWKPTDVLRNHSPSSLFSLVTRRWMISSTPVTMPVVRSLFGPSRKSQLIFEAPLYSTYRVERSYGRGH